MLALREGCALSDAELAGMLRVLADSSDLLRSQISAETVEFDIYIYIYIMSFSL